MHYLYLLLFKLLLSYLNLFINYLLLLINYQIYIKMLFFEEALTDSCDFNLKSQIQPQIFKTLS